MHRTLELVATVYTLGQLKALDILDAPQAALAGRSNVGKSSLINRLGNRKALAKISSTPGKTRSINFFRVKEIGYYLVDLPGYGYARTSKAERAKWAELIEAYIDMAKGLAAVAVLIDCRHDPQNLDLDMVSFLTSSNIPMLPVLTKADKCKQNMQAKRRKQWKEILRTASPILFSSTTGLGRETLWRALDEASGLAPEGPADPEQPGAAHDEDDDVG
jgi:GTP-binding protein